MRNRLLTTCCLFLLIPACLSVLAGCYLDNDTAIDREIIQYSFTSDSNPGLAGDAQSVIAGNDIVVVVPQGTTVTGLVATYTTGGTRLMVGNVKQFNGITPNNFTDPVTYTVYASDNSTRNYAVRVAFGADESHVIMLKGSLPSPPADPEINWIYYNTTDDNSYIWNGTCWDVLAYDSLDGADGIDTIDGISLVWLGPLSEYPDYPLYHYAFYHSVERTSYIWDTVSWEVLCRDGDENTTSFNYPRVVHTNPAGGVVCHLPKTIEIVFNRAMDPDTFIAGDTLAVTGARGMMVDGALAWDMNNRRLAFTPATPFEENIPYTVSIDSTVADLKGQQTGHDYRYDFTVMSSNTLLNSLKISCGRLNPGFSPDATSYSAANIHGRDTITLKCRAANPHAGIMLRLNDGSWSDVYTGKASVQLSLMHGDNSIEIQVTAENGSTGTYFIDVTRTGNWIARESVRDWRAVASSADGSRLAAVVHGGQIYTSSDSGETWNPQDEARSWNCIASSADGYKLAAGTADGGVFTSSDAGMTWTRHLSIPGAGHIASSSDGSRLVAAHNYIYTSADSGETWTQRYHELCDWSGVASSADGTRLVAIEHWKWLHDCEMYIHGGVYISPDAGLTWSLGETGIMKAVSLSEDGSSIIVLTGHNNKTKRGGYILLSDDAGETWTENFSHLGEWSCAASSADGTRLVVANSSDDRRGDGTVYTTNNSGETWIAHAISGCWTSVASSADGKKLVVAGSGTRIFTYNE